MTLIRTISGAAEEIRRNDPHSAITEYLTLMSINHFAVWVSRLVIIMSG